jgi:beta-galactosidase
LLVSAATSAAESTDFNRQWKFFLGDAPTAHVADFDDASWQVVDLPHTPRLEALVIGADGPDSEQWQGICWYRNTFSLQPEDSKKIVLLKFGAAMRVADLWINGQFVDRRADGYLPIVVDITQQVHPDRPNVVAVRLDNFDNPITGPKPLAQLDFNYYGGLYRGAELILKNPLHITDPILANKPASGGIFVTFPIVTDSQATVRVQTHIRNDYQHSRDASIRTTLCDLNGQAIESELSPATTIEADDDAEIIQELSVDKPRLWSVDDPQLYLLRSEVLLDGAVVDQEETRIGIRHFKITKDGFWLNGKKTFLRGTNRHQEYPYVGYALSDNAQYRDAKKIKEAGFDYVRLSHYPQSPAFLDACDELGILAMNCIMGWQYFADTPDFKQHQYDQCHRLIQRDRNHPCVLLWETSLNESRMTNDFMEKIQSIAHQEFPGDQFYTCGWTGDFDVFIQARQHGGCRKVEGRPCVVSEYGDWEYFAQNAGLNQDAWENLQPAERSSRQDRTDGEIRLLQQARNFQEAHNDNLKTTAFADGLWAMFDYNRGYSNDLETSGCMDIFRLPKPSYYFFKSQRPAKTRLANAESGPMVFIAINWTPNSPTTVRVFSNCEQVSLFLNDRLIESRYADDDRFSTHLANPPFTFEIDKFEPGVLKAIGHIGGQEVASHLRETPGKPVRLRLEADLSGRPLSSETNDVVFIRAIVEDAHGTVIPSASGNVLFRVDGPGELIGDNPAPVRAGIASILLRSTNRRGTIRVEASEHALTADSISLEAQ